ncbi:hypothetical protein RRG08_037465 [Elysia crispata]|uniref:Uncharacterized protein n=1 Tax=Elysia crispata TaxID=231223 RepID=A0AAE1AZW4_9GAST|nr:hypothetical protein RRG08_037465 [Elysia crispata]
MREGLDPGHTKKAHCSLLPSPLTLPYDDIILPLHNKTVEGEKQSLPASKLFPTLNSESSLQAAPFLDALRSPPLVPTPELCVSSSPTAKSAPKFLLLRKSLVSHGPKNYSEFLYDSTMDDCSLS